MNVLECNRINAIARTLTINNCFHTNSPDIVGKVLAMLVAKTIFTKPSSTSQKTFYYLCLGIGKCSLGIGHILHLSNLLYKHPAKLSIFSLSNKKRGWCLCNNNRNNLFSCAENCFLPSQSTIISEVTGCRKRVN